MGLYTHDLIWPNYLPKGSTSQYHHIGLGFHRNLGGIQASSPYQLSHSLKGWCLRVQTRQKSVKFSHGFATKQRRSGDCGIKEVQAVPSCSTREYFCQHMGKCSCLCLKERSPQRGVCTFPARWFMHTFTQLLSFTGPCTTSCEMQCPREGASRCSGISKFRLRKHFITSFAYQWNVLKSEGCFNW